MWEYNAPQYVDFTERLDDDKADAYFGTLFSFSRMPSASHEKNLGNYSPRIVITVRAFQL